MADFDREASRVRRDEIRHWLAQRQSPRMSALLEDCDALESLLVAADREVARLRYVLQEIADGSPYSMHALVTKAAAALASGTVEYAVMCEQHDGTRAFYAESSTGIDTKQYWTRTSHRPCALGVDSLVQRTVTPWLPVPEDNK